MPLGSSLPASMTRMTKVISWGLLVIIDSYPFSRNFRLSWLSYETVTNSDIHIHRDPVIFGVWAPQLTENYENENSGAKIAGSRCNMFFTMKEKYTMSRFHRQSSSTKDSSARVCQFTWKRKDNFSEMKPLIRNWREKYRNLLYLFRNIRRIRCYLCVCVAKILGIISFNWIKGNCKVQ